MSGGGFRLISEERVGEGGFLVIRRLRLRVEREDGSLTDEGLWDFVERPVGRDAVVLALFSRGEGGVRVLVRDALRVPLVFGRDDAAARRHTELVAGIIERGEESDAAICRRAADEAREEAGLTVDAADLVRLGPPSFPTAGMCPELFHFMAVEVSAAAIAGAQPPSGDGSPFEEGARIRWLGLDEALADCARGAIADLKTEVALRRLRDYLASR
jgi:ADP-ribose pyrophosphatase